MALVAGHAGGPCGAIEVPTAGTRGGVRGVGGKRLSCHEAALQRDTGVAFLGCMAEPPSRIGGLVGVTSS